MFSNRKMFILFICCIYIALLWETIYIKLILDISNRGKTIQGRQWKWTEVVPNASWIYSAFIDKRGNNSCKLKMIMIRDVTIRNPRLSCVVNYKSTSQNYKVPAKLHKKFGSPTGYRSYPFMYACKLKDSNYENIYLTTGDNERKILIPIYKDTFSANLNSSTYHNNFTVCVGTMYGNYSDFSRLVEFVEFHQIVGFTKFIFYINSISDNFLKYVQFYQRKGIAEVFHWMVHSKDAFYLGQLAMLHDCLYRNMYRTKYLAFLDLDELIVPIHKSTLDALVSSIEKGKHEICGLSFRAKLFSPSPNISNEKNGNLPMYLLRSVSLTERSEHIFKDRVRSKMMVNPRKVDYMHVHYIQRYLQGCHTQVVKYYTAALYHYRQSSISNHENASKVVDKTIFKYTSNLRQKVAQVHEEISSYQTDQQFI